MNIMNRLTWKSMAKNRTRTIVTVIGIALSAALFCGIITMGLSMISYLIDVQTAIGGDYHVSSTVIDSTRAEEIKSREDVSTVAEAQILGMVNFRGSEMGPNSAMVKACNADFFKAMPGFDLVEGRLPENGSELVVGEYLLHTMEALGYPIELGSEITLTVTPYIRAMKQGDSSAAPYTITGTIVGISPFSTKPLYSYEGSDFSYIYTYLEENTPQPLYHDLFMKSTTPFRAEPLAQEIGGKANYELLQYYSIAEANNISRIILGLTLMVVLVIMVGAVSLIYNAFSISVTQRTQEFGLLSSVGATKKQLKASIRCEAGMLCLFGIPIGLILGLVATEWLLRQSSGTVESYLTAEYTGMELHAIVSPIALLGATVIAVGTVLLSAWIPSHRAAKITPIAAIRQEKDYSTQRNAIQSKNKRHDKGNFSANMARKYHQASRKKYRALVASLAISVILFLAATGASSSIRFVADSMQNANNYDFEIMIYGDAALRETIRNHESISRSVRYYDSTCYALIADSYASEQRQDAFAGGDSERRDAWKSSMAHIHYLEDDIFRAFLNEQGIDPEPYFDADNPVAVVFYQEEISYRQKENGKIESEYSQFAPFNSSVSEIVLSYQRPDVELYVVEQMKAQGHDEVMQEAGGGFAMLEDGSVVYREVLTGCQLQVDGNGPMQVVPVGEPQTFTFLAVEETIAEGQTVTRFYAYDEATGLVGDTVIATLDGGISKMGIGAQVNGTPYGLNVAIHDSVSLNMLRPLSMAEWASDETIGGYLRLSTSNYFETKAFLDSFAEEFTIMYFDYVEEQYNSRQASRLMDLFAYAFVCIIAMIAIANVFNTVYTNILLRRKDFGMLRSLGMTNYQMQAMVAKESLICGIHTLCWSLPVGLFADYLVKRMLTMALISQYSIPWATIAIATASVFVVMGSSMLYALHCVQKDNPIEAIRMENI